MSIINDCYDYIIGLTQSNCDCYDIPADAGTSLSGLFITDMASLAWIETLTNCEAGDLWTQMERSRDLAVTTFQADTNAKLMQGFKLKRLNFVGTIGRGVTKGVVTQTIGKYYGVRWHCANVKSGIGLVKGIGTLFTATGSITLEIWNNLGDLVQTLTLNTEALKHKQNALNIELPLHSPYIENLEYYFIYQATANQARNNDIKCNCGGFKPVFDTHKPYFNHSQHDRNYGWSHWLMVGGYYGDFPDFENCSHTTSNHIYGLTVDVELKCKVSEVLCMESLDFESNNLAGAMALAIQHKAASILAGWIINSKNLSRYNITETDLLIENIKTWDRTYNSMVEYIATEADVSANDCLVCRDIFEMTRRGIMA